MRDATRRSERSARGTLEGRSGLVRQDRVWITAGQAREMVTRRRCAKRFQQLDSANVRDLLRGERPSRRTGEKFLHATARFEVFRTRQRSAERGGGSLAEQFQ